MTCRLPVSKICDRERLIDVVIEARQVGRRIVFTNGCFDLLHAGHLRLLGEARAAGDLLIVAVNADSSLRDLKGPLRPITSEKDRATIIAAFECVDYVTIFAESTPLALLQLLKPDVHVKGSDYDPDDNERMPEAAFVRAYGGRILLVDLVTGRSTSEMLAAIRGASIADETPFS